MIADDDELELFTAITADPLGEAVSLSPRRSISGTSGVPPALVACASRAGQRPVRALPSREPRTSSRYLAVKVGPR